MPLCFYINNSPQPGTGQRAKMGGGSQSLLTLWQALPPLAWRGEIVCPAEGPFTDSAREVGAAPLIYPYAQPQWQRPLSTWRNHRAWKKIITALQPDIIHANAIDAARSVASAAANLHVPLICHVRFPSSRDDIPWAFRNLPKPTAFIFNSRALHDEMWPTLSIHCHTSRAYVVHNAVDLKVFTPTPQPRSHPFRIGIIGNLTPMKAHDVFLLMAAEVVKHGLNAEFLIVGDDVLNLGREQELRDLTKQLCIENHVRFLGHRSDIAAVLADLHLLVLTSRIEPFGRVLIEAMACGRPVIAMNVGGIPEIIKEGETGYIVDAGDYQTMAQRVIGLLNDPIQWEKLSRQGAADAASRFSAEHHAQTIVKIYEELITSAT